MSSRKQSSDDKWGWNVHYSVLDFDTNDVVGSYVSGPYTIDEAVEWRREMAANPGVTNVYLARAVIGNENDRRAS